MDAKVIQRYQKKTIPQLLKLATKHFNAFIRQRDFPLGCISCANGKVEDAGHFYPSTYSALRFNEDNVNGQCSFSCNKMKSGNLHEYRKNLIKKIGIEKVMWLDDHAHDQVKFDRFTLIHYIETYRDKVRGD